MLRARIKSLKVEAHPERFFKKIDTESERNPVIGNARPQNTYNQKLDDQELGSLVLFKIPRHCRNNHKTPGEGMNDSKESLNFKHTEQSTENLFITQPHGSRKGSRGVSSSP